MKHYAMNLQLFAEEGAVAAPAAGAETGTAAETVTEAPQEFRVGDTLADGSQVADARVAAALNRQMNRHPELRKVYGQGQQQARQAQPGPAEAPAAGNETGDIQARWDAAKKGEFKELFGQDVQRAIQDRFKNQADANRKLSDMQPMLDALMHKAGVNSIEELSKAVLNDDSMLEDEAEERGMTTEQLRQFKEMERQNAELIKEKQNAEMRNHFAGLLQQGEELKSKYPDFDFYKEMENEQFRALTHPDLGLSVEQAYYAIHGKELVPQLMAYGMQRAQEQMGQTIQAQRSRPAEGAMNRNAQAAEPKLNPSSMNRQERNKIKEWVRVHGPISFDGGGKKP